MTTTIPRQTSRSADRAWYEQEADEDADMLRAASMARTEGMTENQRQAVYLRVLVKLMRRANNRAADYSRKWEKLNDEVNDWMRRMRIDDLIEQAKVKEANLTLVGHMAAWSFWERESKRYSSAIMAEEAAARMLFGLGQG